MGKSKRNKPSSSSAANRKNGPGTTSPDLLALSGSELIRERARLKELELKNGRSSEPPSTVVTNLDIGKNGSATSTLPASSELRLSPFGRASPLNCIKVLNKSTASPVSSSMVSQAPVKSVLAELPPVDSIEAPTQKCAHLVPPPALNLISSGTVAESSSKTTWNDDERDLGLPKSIIPDSEHSDSEYSDSENSDTSDSVSSPSVSRTLGDSDSISEDVVLKAFDSSAHLASPGSISSSVNTGMQAKPCNGNLENATVNVQTKVGDVETKLGEVISDENITNVGNLGKETTGRNLANNTENGHPSNDIDAISEFWLNTSVSAQIVVMIRRMASGKYLNLGKLRSNDIPNSEIKFAMNVAAYFTRKSIGLDRDAIKLLVSEVDILHAVNVLEHVRIVVEDASQKVDKEGVKEKASGNRDARPSLPKNSAWRKPLHPTNRVLDNSRKIEKHPTNVIDVETDLNKEESILIGHFVGKFPPRKDFEVVRRGWNVNSRVITHASSWIIIKLDNDQDLEKVLNGGPYIINGISLLLRRLPKLFNFRKDDICVLPIWIRLPNLPLELYNKKCIGKIAQNLGEPLFIDELTDMPVAYNYARALVEIDVSEVTPDEILVPFSDGSSLIQKVIYEQFNGYCKVCKCLGHYTANCKASSKSDSPTTQDTTAKPVETSSLTPESTTGLQNQAPKLIGSAQDLFGKVLVLMDQIKGVLGELAAPIVPSVISSEQGAAIDDNSVQNSALQDSPAQLDSVQTQTALLNTTQAMDNSPSAHEAVQPVTVPPALIQTARLDSIAGETSQVAAAPNHVDNTTVVGASSTAPFHFDGTPVGEVWNNNGKSKKGKRKSKKNDAPPIIALPAVVTGSSLKPSQ